MNLKTFLPFYEFTLQNWSSDEAEPNDEKILVIGADLKHVLRTVAGSVDFKGSFRFVLADPNPHIQGK